MGKKQTENKFAELKPAFSYNQALSEANRCLFCYNPPCTKACPTHIDIPLFIKKIASGNLKGSAKTIIEANWIALTCAKACPVEELCESACVYNNKGEKPIEIARLQRFVIEWFIDQKMPNLFTKKPRNKRSVGVIGAGPAGLSCAAELALMGYDVTIYEGKKLPGGLANYGVAPYKISFQDSFEEVKLIKNLGVKIKTGIWVGENVAISQIEAKHDAIFMGIGLGKSINLNIPGENIKEVIDALEFIASVRRRQWRSINIGNNVAVIGGGNTAIESARIAKRLGAENVIVIYRRTQTEMPAYKYEYELAKKEGIIFYFLTAPKRIHGNKKVISLECIKMKLGERDLDGRRIPLPIPHSEFIIPVNMVIKALGQKSDEIFLSQIPKLKMKNGLIVVNSETMQTSNPKYFAGGDCINGGKEVVSAVADGKRAAHGIDKYILKTYDKSKH